MFAVLVILSLNMIFIVVTSIYAFAIRKHSDTSFTSAVLYEGRCTVPKGWVSGLHLIINILSTGLLSASNYCMQHLNAPSRQDVDRAHENRTWLSIGVQNFRNLLVVGRKQATLWGLLLITSLPIHLL
jgi:hypothetical protein